MIDRQCLEQCVEPLARLLAAQRMGLIKDPYGERLPHDLWSQKMPEARKQLGLD
jgi:hypothetical protein